MKKVKVELIIVFVTGMCFFTTATSLGMYDEERGGGSLLESRFMLYSWPDGAYYTASFFGAPFEGILSPGEPVVIDVPGIIHAKLKIVDIDEYQFTLEYLVTYGGIILFNQVSTYGHGLYAFYYSPFAPTPTIWDFDFNLFMYNGPGKVNLWTLCTVPDSEGFSYKAASQQSGHSDISFAFQDFITVDAHITEYGDTTNTFDHTIESPWTTQQSEQLLPLGYFTIAYKMAYQSPIYDKFEIADKGCSMAHCDVWMSDNPHMLVPTDWDTQILWHDTIPAGSNLGLGCSSNGTLAACTYQDTTGDNLVVYDASGNRLWTSGDHLGDWTWTSAAMIDDSGGVIAVDSEHLVRFNPDGTIKWKTPTPGGVPISPVITYNGVVVLATQSGPLSAYETVSGTLLGELYLKESADDPVYYDTINTPCVAGNRVYVSTEKNDCSDRTARLWAVDVDPGNPDGVLQDKWSFEFGGPSGASPLIVGDTIYFDGDRIHPGQDKNPHLFAVQDNGETCSLKWLYSMRTSIKASVSSDPRGGVWAFGVGQQWLCRLDQETGELMNLLDIDILVDEPGDYKASAVLTIAGDPASPVMITSACTHAGGKPSYVIAIDLEAEDLLWKVKLADDWEEENTNAQFAILEDQEGMPVVVFPGNNSGAYGVGTTR